MDRPDIVLVGIPVVVLSGYTVATISHALGAAGVLAGLIRGIGYLAAAVLICWAVWTRIDRTEG